MNITNLTKTPVNATYQFTIGGEKGKYNISFLIENEQLKIHCTCNRNLPCWHAEYILAGKTSRIITGDTALQGELIRQADTTSEGSSLVRKAKRKFAGETHCRRCSSERIVRLKNSFSATFFTLFKDTTNHTYYCKSCKWTW